MVNVFVVYHRESFFHYLHLQVLFTFVKTVMSILHDRQDSIFWFRTRTKTSDQDEEMLASSFHLDNIVSTDFESTVACAGKKGISIDGFVIPVLFETVMFKENMKQEIRSRTETIFQRRIG